MFDVEKIREEFPILNRTVYGRPLVYLDSGATAQKPRAVIECMDLLHRELNANIHRGVHWMSSELTSRYEAAREEIRKYIGAGEREEIIFTSGATASINLVAYSWGERFLHKGDNIIVSEMEHHSNIVPWQIVAERKGVEIRVLPFDDDGRMCIEQLDSLLDGRTRMVAVTAASNTLGTRPPLRTITDKAHAAGAVVLVDASQGIVHGTGCEGNFWNNHIHVGYIKCDFCVFSGHKIYGPTGIGVLYGRRELLEQMPPFMGGGEMVGTVTFAKTTYAPLPLKFEAGTPNYIGAIGLGEAIRFVGRMPACEIMQHEAALMARAEKALTEIDGLRIYGTTPTKCPIISFGVEGVHNYDIGMVLDKLGIAIRTGHHCAEPVMQHYGTAGMCRASLAMYNTETEIDALTDGVRRAVRMLRTKR